MEFKTSPKAHQLALLELSKDLDFKGVFWEMGTGKTKFAIDWIRYKFYHHGQVLNTLIVAPKIALINWKDEFIKHSSSGSIVYPLIKAVDRRRKLLESVKHPAIFVTNFEAIAKLEQTLIEKKIDIIVVDESHLIKNPTAKVTKSVHSLARYSKYRLALTGTPMPNGALDVWSQAYFLDFGATFGTSYFGYRNSFFRDENAGNPHVQFSKYVLLDVAKPIINQLIAKIADVKRKDECLDLPPKVYQTMQLEMEKDQKKAYDDMLEDYIAYLQEDVIVADTAAIKQLRLNQISSGFYKNDDGKEVRFKKNPKLDALKQVLECVDAKVIVWCVFRNNIFLLQEELKKYNPACIFGDTKDKYAEEAKFKTDDSCKIMIANPQSASVAINLVEASYAIYYSQDFNLVNRVQSEDRCHRIGSERHDSVTYIDLVFPKSIDEIVIKAVKYKQDLSKELLNIDNWQ